MRTKKRSVYGYARFTTDDPQLDEQIKALVQYGVERDRIFTDGVARGAARPGFKAAFTLLRPGAVLVVCKIDRLGRDLSEVVQSADIVRQSGATLVSLAEDIDTSTATGSAMYEMIGTLAQIERGMIVERTKSGIAAARDKGRNPGRRSQMTPDIRRVVVDHMRAGLSFVEIAPMVGVSKSTLYNFASELRAEMAAVELVELAGGCDGREGDKSDACE